MLARVTGLEPATSGVTGRRSNQLSYTRIGRALDLERPKRHVNPRLDKIGNQSKINQKRMGGDGIEPPANSV
jgi:hypothetical protein